MMCIIQPANPTFYLLKRGGKSDLHSFVHSYVIHNSSKWQQTKRPYPAE